MYLFRISFKNSLVYRWSVIFSIVGSVLFISINLVLWGFLYKDDPKMVSYMTRYTIVSNIISLCYARGIAQRIGSKFASGDFVTDLIRPINLFTMSWEIELSSICSVFLTRGLPVILVYLPALIKNAGYYNIPLVLLAVVMGHVLCLLIYSFLGFSAFILIEIWPFTFLLDDTIRLLAGGFIPLRILPPFLGVIAYILPFRFLYSFPLELLFGNADMSNLAENFGLFLVWIAFFAVLNLAMYRAALKKAVVQGG